MKTSYYAQLKKQNLEGFIPTAISGDEGKLVGFQGKAMRKLSPYSFFRKWKEKETEIENNFKTGKISKEEYQVLKTDNQQDYIQKFYTKVLKPLNPIGIYNELGENAVLLCFEKPTDFCHRFLVASWLEMNLGIKIDELGFENDMKVIENKEKLRLKLQEVIEQEKTNER